MPEDKTILTAEGTQYFDVLRRATGAGEDLARSGEGVGKGFLKGERVAESATRALTTGLLTAQNAGDALAITMESIVRVLKLPLVTGIAATAGVTGAIVLRREFEKTEQAFDALKKATRVPITISANLSPDDIGSRMDDIAKSIEVASKRADTFGEKVARFFAPAASFGMSSGAIREKEQKEAILNSEKQLAALGTARADSELKIANLTARQKDDGEDMVDIHKAEITAEQKRAKLLEEFIQKGGNVLDFYKRFLALQVILGATIRDEIDKTSQKAKEGLRDFAQKATDFFTDVGSGKFVQNLDQERLRELQEQRGRELVEQLRRDRDAGIPLGPNAQAILRQADKLAQQAKTGLQALVNADFTNLLDLSKYDFTGLLPLSGLTINIQ